MTHHTSEARHVCRFEAIFGTDEVRAKRELSGKCAAFQLWTPTYS